MENQKIYVRICDRNNTVIKKVNSLLKKEFEGCKLVHEKEVTAVDKTQQIDTITSTLRKIEESDICVFVTDPFGGLTLQSLFEYSFAVRQLGIDNVIRVKPPYLWEQEGGFMENAFR